MYGYGYRYNSGLVVGGGTPPAPPFTNTYSTLFDGVDDYVDCGSLSTLQNATEFSISCWFKTPLTAVNGIWTWFDGADGWLELNCSADGSMIANVTRFNHTSATYGIAAAGTLTADTWYNATVVFDGSGATNADRLKLYVNGNLITLTFIGTIPTQTGTMLSSGLHIGERFNGQNYFNGNIDEVSIFNSAISISDVWDSSGVPTDLSLLATPPLHWYRMGDNGSYKSPQWLLPSNENKDKVSNYSFQLDGVDDYVNCGNPTDLQITGAFTLSVWMKLDSTVGTQACAISKDNGTSERAFTLWSKIVNKPVFYIWNGATSYNVGGTTNIADDTWHHVAVVYVPSTSIRIYVDGLLEGNNTTSIPASINNANYDFKIGEFAGSLFEFKGLMDEVAVFNSDQSANIATLYNSGTPTTLPSGAVAHWRMGEEATFSGGVWTVPDSVGSNNGTSNAMTIEDRVGDAPNSENNALSYNMDEVDRVTDTP